MAVPLCGQNPLYLDLAGEWRTKLADDPAYARPDFDDSGRAAFTLRAPVPDEQFRQSRWLRWSVVSPAGGKTDDLVLTIGGFRKSYEVFVNEVKIWDFSQETPPHAKLYPVPPQIPAPYLDSQEVAVEAGLPLGILREAEYQESECRLPPGQQLLFVSDGVIEAANARGELFGFERTQQISRKLAEDIAAAAQAWGQNDDITVVTVRRNG